MLREDSVVPVTLCSVIRCPGVEKYTSSFMGHHYAQEPLLGKRFLKLCLVSGTEKPFLVFPGILNNDAVYVK